jgi:hypothetical protein
MGTKQTFNLQQRNGIDEQADDRGANDESQICIQIDML